MLNEQVMIDTVGRLIEAGIDDPTIISTLVDAGLTTEEANAILSKVKQPKQEETPQQQAVQPQEVQILRAQVETQAQQQDLHQTMVSTALDDHTQKLDNIAKSVDDVKTTMDTNKSPPDVTLSFKVSEMEKKLDDISAATKASMDLLQKILENNRKILVELEDKK